MISAEFSEHIPGWVSFWSLLPLIQAAGIFPPLLFNPNAFFIISTGYWCKVLSVVAKIKHFIWNMSILFCFRYDVSTKPKRDSNFRLVFFAVWYNPSVSWFSNSRSILYMDRFVCFPRKSQCVHNLEGVIQIHWFFSYKWIPICQHFPLLQITEIWINTIICWNRWWLIFWQSKWIKNFVQN